MPRDTTMLELSIGEPSWQPVSAAASLEGGA
jgi:hypothetical protein